MTELMQFPVVTGANKKRKFEVYTIQLYFFEILILSIVTNLVPRVSTLLFPKSGKES